MAWGSSQNDQVIGVFYYTNIYKEDRSFLLLLQDSSSSIHHPSLRQLLVAFVPIITLAGD
jgi:hypothetical protein